MIHNQTLKGERLKKLVDQFMRKKLKNDVQDVNHAVIQVLTLLSYNPLHKGILSANSVVDRPNISAKDKQKNSNKLLV